MGGRNAIWRLMSKRWRLLTTIDGEDPKAVKSWWETLGRCVHVSDIASIVDIEARNVWTATGRRGHISGALMLTC